MNYAVLICPFSFPSWVITFQKPTFFVALGRVQRCPRPWATLSSAVCNVVLGREQRTCPLRGTNGCYLSMDFRQVEVVGRFRDVEDRCLGI